MKREYRGVLISYFETGSEGLIWAMQRTGLEGHEGLIILKAGDYLDIYSPEGEIIFSDVIKPDMDIGLRRQLPGHRLQQSAKGFWIHWIQKGFEADDWASYFIGEEYSGRIVRDIESE